MEWRMCSWCCIACRRCCVVRAVDVLGGCCGVTRSVVSYIVMCSIPQHHYIYTEQHAVVVSVTALENT